MLLQDPDDLLFRNAAKPEVLVLLMGQNNRQAELSQRAPSTGLIERRGKPDMIVSDYGTEFTSNAILAWAQVNGVA